MDNLSGEIQVGSVFAGLTVVRELGRGGAGIVYLARDESLDRLVALKVLHSSSMEGDAAAAERFRNEALIAAKLEHPAIIPIYTTGVERGRQFIAMRYVPGRSLASYLNELAPLPTADAVRLLRPVAAALDYAADFDVVHRDVKPANIFVDESSTAPRTMLGDFGIARAYEGTRHTATGGWVGTPEYIAPEILKDDKPDARADQYSLACVLVECITGTSPFKRSNTAATVTAQVTEEPDLDNATGIGAATAEALRIGLEKNPHDRYGSCTEMLDAVEASLTRRDTTTPNTIVRRRKRGKLQRRVRIVATVTVTVLGLALGVAQVTGFNLRAWLQGDGGTVRATTTQSDPVDGGAAADGAAPADVVVLGSDLQPNSSWKFRAGVTAPAVVEAAFADNAGTIGLEVETIPLADAADCAGSLTDLSMRMPTTAVVVLETSCPKQVVKRLGSVSVESPPIYWLGANWEDLEAARAFIEHPPSKRYPERDPAISSEFGEIAADRFVPLQLPTRVFFEAGVLARKLQRRSCALIVLPDAYGAELLPGVMLAGMDDADSPASVEVVEVERFEDVDPSRDLAGHDCVAVPWWFEESSAGIRTFKEIVDADPQRPVITMRWLPDPLTRWSASKANVFLLEDWTWLPNGVPQARHSVVGTVMFRNWDEAFVSNYRAPLLYVDDLVAHQLRTGEAGSLPADEWVEPRDAGAGTDVVTYHHADGILPTEWGFSTGYNVLIENNGVGYDLVGGSRDPDWPASLTEAMP